MIAVGEYYGIQPLSDRDDEIREPDPDGFTEIMFQGPYEFRSKEFMPKGGRLKTHWGQRECYNMFTKFCYEGSETHMCPVGCGAVAVGQYLYWSHYEHGIPVNTVNDASYDQATNTFSFSGNTPDFWDLMMSDTNPVPYDIPYMMRPTAIFLGFIGTEIKIKYGCNGSASIPANEMAALKKHLSTPFIEKDCSSDIVLSILSRQYPVYCMGKEDGSKNRGHVFIIDYCRHEYSMSTIYYVTVPCEAGGDVSEEIPDLGDSVTYEELREYYDQIREEVSISRDNYIKINWGWNGRDDNVEYNLDAISWKGDGTDYNRRKIFYPSNINLN